MKSAINRNTKRRFEDLKTRNKRNGNGEKAKTMTVDDLL
jgi:hypothetical protein